MQSYKLNREELLRICNEFMLDFAIVKGEIESVNKQRWTTYTENEERENSASDKLKLRKFGSFKHGSFLPEVYRLSEDVDKFIRVFSLVSQEEVELSCGYIQKLHRIKNTDVLKEFSEWKDSPFTLVNKYQDMLECAKVEDSRRSSVRSLG